MPQFENTDNQRDLLIKKLVNAGIDVSTWGKGGAKTIDHLLNEIEGGETVLITDENDELLRAVVVGGADVYYSAEDGKKYRLKEDRQIFKDGRERQRDFTVSVSEKMKPNEDPKEAMVRGVQEELGIMGDIALTETGSYEETVDSPSYPGLRSQYIHHNYQVELTQEQFNPEGYVEEQTDKSTYFVWEEVK